MKQVLFATTNESKSKRFSKDLQAKGIEVLNLRDLNLILDIPETGKNVIENALIKARVAFEQTKMPTIGMDDSLYLENVPEDVQPGLFVRRVKGKTLTDEEMLDYYTNLVKKYGKNGRIDCKWVYGLVVINKEGKEATYTWEKNNFYMVDIRSNKINVGYPLNTISKYKAIDKYFTDVTEEEKEKLKIDETDVVEFIANHI